MFSFFQPRPKDLGIHGFGLLNCPGSPNCVCSDHPEENHRIEPLILNVPAEGAWRITCDHIKSMKRTEVIHCDENYLHAECRSAFFGFIDDLELHLRAGENIIALRSAARMGYSDMGVNRRRVEELRNSLKNQGIVR